MRNNELWEATMNVPTGKKGIEKKYKEWYTGENKEEILQINAIIKNAIKYTVSDWDSVKNYKCGTYDSHRAKFIPYSYLHKRLSLNNAFKKDKRGATEATPTKAINQTKEVRLLLSRNNTFSLFIIYLHYFLYLI